MRVNIYAEEMTDRIEIIGKEIDGHMFTGLRFYLYLPVTTPQFDPTREVRGPFLHREGDDDSSAVTFWGKRDLREVLRQALTLLDGHYEASTPQPRPVHTEALEPSALVKEFGGPHVGLTRTDGLGPLTEPEGVSDLPEHNPLPWEAFAEKIIVAEPERVRVVIRAANFYRVAVEDNPERWEQALADFEFICSAVNVRIPSAAKESK